MYILLFVLFRYPLVQEVQEVQAVQSKEVKEKVNGQI
jgi:hypothetical protein